MKKLICLDTIEREELEGLNRKAAIRANARREAEAMEAEGKTVMDKRGAQRTADRTRLVVALGLVLAVWAVCYIIMSTDEKLLALLPGSIGAVIGAVGLR